MIVEGNEIVLTKGDITKLKVDCIVNAANKSLLGGGGVDGAIHKAAGRKLYEECLTLHGCKTGEAKITLGYNLPAKRVIHTVGPIYSGKESDKFNLAACYKNSLDLAVKNGVKSIAFPSISTGFYGYPPDEAAEIVMQTLDRWCRENIDCRMKIILCCFDSASYNYYQKYFV